jgi:hypothetical protein
MRQSFIPQDRPKSWVIFSMAILIGLLVFAPLALVGSLLASPPLADVGRFGFFVSWFVAIVAWFIVMLKHKRFSVYVPPRIWREQVW